MLVYILAYACEYDYISILTCLMLCRHERHEREFVAKRRVDRLDDAPLPRVEARVLRVKKHL